MPTKTKINPDQVYVCRESISLGQVVLKAGDRRNGADPLVLAHPDRWAADGTPIKVEGPDPAPNPKPRAEVHAVAYESLEPFDGVVLRRPLRVRHQGQVHQLAVGTIFARDSELVRLCPDAFEKPSVKR